MRYIPDDIWNVIKEFLLEPYWKYYIRIKVLSQLLEFNDITPSPYHLRKEGYLYYTWSLIKKIKLLDT